MIAVPRQPSQPRLQTSGQLIGVKPRKTIQVPSPAPSLSSIQKQAPMLDNKVSAGSPFSGVGGKASVGSGGFGGKTVGFRAGGKSGVTTAYASEYGRAKEGEMVKTPSTKNVSPMRLAVSKMKKGLATPSTMKAPVVQTADKAKTPSIRMNLVSTGAPSLGVGTKGTIAVNKKSSDVQSQAPMLDNKTQSKDTSGGNMSGKREGGKQGTGEKKASGQNVRVIHKPPHQFQTGLYMGQAASMSGKDAGQAASAVTGGMRSAAYAIGREWPRISEKVKPVKS